MFARMYVRVCAWVRLCVNTTPTQPFNLYKNQKHFRSHNGYEDSDGKKRLHVTVWAAGSRLTFGQLNATLSHLMAVFGTVIHAALAGTQRGNTQRQEVELAHVFVLLPLFSRPSRQKHYKAPSDSGTFL
jgi:hypothetical protein